MVFGPYMAPNKGAIFARQTINEVATSHRPTLVTMCLGQPLYLAAYI